MRLPCSVWRFTRSDDCPSDVSFTPKSGHLQCNRMSAMCQKRTSAVSFDHLVGKRDECWRDFEAKSLGGLKVEHEFELGRLHDR